MAASKKKRVHEMKYRIPAIIFAGGKSSRMGQDKALLPFAGYRTLAQYQYERLQLLFDKVYLSAKKNKFDFPSLLITDRYEISSPLAGIVSIFETLEADEVFILSVDAPFVGKEVIEKLLEVNRENVDAVIAKSPNGLQPLCGIYRRSLFPSTRQRLKENNHRLGHLLLDSNSHFVDFEENTPFVNLNYPHEYEKALKQL
jgi:molybdopterin-guanine dinucleotide biosynthesis protein A